MRSLAKCVRLGPVHKHPNADRLSIALVGGWEVVVSIASREGDEGVYFEIDSILPEADWTAALPTRKIKTIKLRGILSQGLFIPWGDIPCMQDKCFEEGRDVTEDLGVVKRADPQDLPDGVTTATGSGSVPFVDAIKDGPPKTDEPRIQSTSYLLDLLRLKPYYISLKYDGCSATYGYDDDEFRVLSRNFVVDRKDSVYWHIATQYDLPLRLKLFSDLVVQGEIVGPKIQGNPFELKAPEFRVFSIWSKRMHAYMPYQETIGVIEAMNQKGNQPLLEQVQVIEKGDCFDKDIKLLLHLAEGYYENTRNPREGIVVRSMGHPRVSFKVISNKYLLKTKQ